jgi:hypothetical protein
LGYVKNPSGVNAAWVRSGQYEIVVNGKRFAAKAFLRAPNDPERKRILV